MSKLEELIAALEKAEGFDRELDLQIGLLVDGWKLGYLSKDFVWSEGLGTSFVKDHEGNINSAHPGGMYPSYTESLDEAVALVNRVLPATTMNVRIASDGSAHVQIFSHPEHRGLDPRGQHVTPAIALCIAVLRAKLGQEEV